MQDNVRFGNEAQLLGGYAAGWLLLSALTALVYIGFWLRCMLLLLGLDKVSPSILTPPGMPPHHAMPTGEVLPARLMTEP